MSRASQVGFTLVEAIVVIVILGIVGAGIAIFMRAPFQAYFDTARRAGMTDAVDNALRRISRDVHAALPNSLYVPPGDKRCVQFIPAEAGGRYRQEVDTSGGGDVLKFFEVDTSFDVLAGSGFPLAGGTHHVVVYNLGIAGADAYAGDNRARITGFTGGALSFTGTQFPFESPGKRFQVIPDQSVVYSCAGGTLIRTTTGLARIGACPLAGGAELIGAAVACGFDYQAAYAESHGLLDMTVVHTREDESVRAHHEVHVNNVP